MWLAPCRRREAQSFSDRFKSSVKASANWSSVVGGKVYFYDIPNAKQSVIQIGYPALAATDGDYYPATVMNHIFSVAVVLPRV